MDDQILQRVTNETGPPDTTGVFFNPVECRPIGFGEFLAIPASRSLLHRGIPVELGGRAFDLLMVLLRSRGTLVTHNEIVHYVWPSTIVDESNLRFQMACLRKALGAARDYIKTVPGRGYLFIGVEDDEGYTWHLSEVHARRVDEPQSCRPSIFVIAEDDVIREALDRLLRSFEVKVASFSSVEALIEQNVPYEFSSIDAPQEQRRLAG